jgi:cbb3-type cytochrome oxidase maturation protein
MESLYLLVPLSVGLVLALGWVFWWALQGGQFDDLEGPAYRILLDEEHPGAATVEPEHPCKPD